MTNRARCGIGMLYHLSTNMIYLSMCHENNSKIYIHNKIALKEGISLILEVENMLIWVEKLGNVLVDDKCCYGSSTER